MSGVGRSILHADMDAFYAAVEQRDDPALRGKPVLVAFDSPRSVVTTASYEARPFGVGSAMPLAQAKRRCPQAIVVPPRFAQYQAVSAQIFEIFGSLSPLVEGLSLDEAFIDLTGTRGLWGSAEEAARRLKELVWTETGLRVSVGVAACKFVAKVASDLRKPDALVVVPAEQTQAFLAPLPVSRLWGVGEKSVPKLQSLGLRTIGDVAAADRAWLVRALGSHGPFLPDLALGRDERPVVPDRDAKSIGSEQTLMVDAVGRDAIWPHLIEAADTIAFRLRREHLRAGGVRVKLKTADFQLVTHQARVAPPTSSARALLATAAELLPRFDLRLPYRLVGLAAWDLRPDSEPVQPDLFTDRERQRDERLDKALDAVRDRFGRTALRRASHRDEAHHGD
ncbi:MAG: DNA polymerase IV [Deltaproteobacteria bacterium]|nr:DNA polymerase IV [Deltaproteobacteria bacterium]